MQDRQFQTDQEKFWAEEFGTEYIDRNTGDQLTSSNISFFAKSLKSVQKISTCIEFGSNVGVNLKALQCLFPELQSFGIEINTNAAQKLAKTIGDENIFNGSILDFEVSKTFDLVLIKGVLIHINPKYLNKVYKKLYESTHKYILIAEYYNPTPIEIEYRGNRNKLFKRDFAGEILDLYEDLELLDYGFVYYRDLFPQDDITWFLLKK